MFLPGELWGEWEWYNFYIRTPEGAVDTWMNPSGCLVDWENLAWCLMGPHFYLCNTVCRELTPNRGSRDKAHARQCKTILHSHLVGHVRFPCRPFLLQTETGVDFRQKIHFHHVFTLSLPQPVPYSRPSMFATSWGQQAKSCLLGDERPHSLPAASVLNAYWSDTNNLGMLAKFNIHLVLWFYGSARLQWDERQSRDSPLHTLN